MGEVSRAYILEALVEVLERAGYVNDKAMEKLSDAVDVVFDDPRNGPEE